MRDQRLRNIDVKLFPFWEQYAEYALLAKSLHAERGDNRAVLAAGNRDHSVAALAVFFEPVANPCDNFIFYFFRVKTHVSTLLFMLFYISKSFFIF